MSSVSIHKFGGFEVSSEELKDMDPLEHPALYEESFLDKEVEPTFKDKPKNRGFKKFREQKEKRRDKENKPRRSGRDTSFLDE